MTRIKEATLTQTPEIKHRFRRMRSYWVSLFSVYFLEGLLLLAVKLATNAPIDVLTRDPLAVKHVDHIHQPYVGFFSNIGILLWCAAVVMCLFSAYLLRRSGRREFSRFFMASASLTFILLIDDLFMVHEAVFPNYLNLSEKVLYAGYGIFMFGYLIRFRKTLLKTEGLFFLLAITQLLLSVSLDNIIPILLPGWSHHQLTYLLEDGAKLLGITTWAAYFTLTCTQQISRILPTPMQSPS